MLERNLSSRRSPRRKVPHQVFSISCIVRTFVRVEDLDGNAENLRVIYVPNHRDLEIKRVNDIYIPKERFIIELLMRIQLR